MQSDSISKKLSTLPRTAYNVVVLCDNSSDFQKIVNKLIAEDYRYMIDNTEITHSNTKYVKNFALTISKRDNVVGWIPLKESRLNMRIIVHSNFFIES